MCKFIWKLEFSKTLFVFTAIADEISNDMLTLALPNRANEICVIFQASRETEFIYGDETIPLRNKRYESEYLYSLLFLTRLYMRTLHSDYWQWGLNIALHYSGKVVSGICSLLLQNNSL